MLQWQADVQRCHVQAAASVHAQIFRRFLAVDGALDIPLGFPTGKPDVGGANRVELGASLLWEVPEPSANKISTSLQWEQSQDFATAGASQKSSSWS